MATEQVTVIEGDGSSDNVTVTDDPVEDSTVQAVVDRLERVLKDQDNIDEVRVALTADDLPGNLDVSVEDQTGDVAVTLDGETVSVDSLPSLPQGSNRIGSVVVDGQPVGVSVDGQTGDLEVTLGTETVSVDSLPAVDISSQSAGIATESTLDAIKAAAQALDDALASNGTDEIRVTSPSPLDVSGAEVDVNLTSQGLQNVSVDLASDSLAGNLDVDLAAASAEPLDVSASTVSVQEDTPLDVSAAEVDVDLASQTGPALDVSGATVAVQEASALDVSAATVDVQEATALDVSAATVPVEQQTPVQVEDSGGTAIDPATEGKLENVRALLDKLDDALASVASDTLRTEQQTPVGVEDSQGTPVDPATTSDVQAVESAVGDESTASQEADSALSATAIERLTALVDALESGRATDELRVSSVKGATPVPTPIVERKLVSTSGTPEAVRSSATSLGSGAEVRGLPTNSGNAYVWISGGSKSESRILQPGDEVFLPTSDLSNVIVDVDTGGEGVSVVAA